MTNEEKAAREFMSREGFWQKVPLAFCDDIVSEGIDKQSAVFAFIADRLNFLSRIYQLAAEESRAAERRESYAKR